MTESTGDMPRNLPADAAGIAEALALLRAGEIVAVPTETVYGLAADAANAKAVARIFAAKGRPTINPLIVHVENRAMAARYAGFSPLADRLADAFWPGPLTLVLPRLPDALLAPAVSAGLATVAIRVPAHPAMQGVIAALGRAVAAPSANPSGRLSPTQAAHVRGLDIPLILDAGACASGLESSIVAVDGERLTLLRPGALGRETLEQVAGCSIAIAGPDADISAPGMLLRHYAPRLPLRLNAETAAADEWHIGFGAIAGDDTLSAAANLDEAAANLFAALHAAEASGRAAIAVAPIPLRGAGVAINDRLARAARG